ncbi:VCBS domain-containing protein, partial [Falsiroseomonas sp. HW251]|uniref:VCBS domain-containing protein n=1 Tax=Falsiroseomonas sp. HW251 TaxID=3390998 RepID=UPI003D31C211
MAVTVKAPSKGVAQVAIKNTPQAVNDTGTISENGTTTLNVLANDLGGGAKQLWSIYQDDPSVQTAVGVDVEVVADKIEATILADGQLELTIIEGAYDYLGAGQTATVTFNYSIRMSNGAISVAQVTLTITGTNDGPVLSDTADPAAVVELSDAAAQNLAAITGSFAVTDLDVGDTLTPSVVGSPEVKLDGLAFVLPAGAAALVAPGAFSLTGAVSNGGATSIGYSYDPGAANLDFLRAGQSLTITYAVKVNDGTTDSATQNVTFTITGTNDAPVAVDDTATGDEDTAQTG